MVVLLLSKGAALDLHDSFGGTALIVAAFQGNLSTVRRLLRAGARSDLVTKNGATALEMAENKGHTAVAQFIREHTAPSAEATAQSMELPEQVEMAALKGDEAAVKARLATIREAIANPKPSGPPPAAPGAPKVYRRDGPASADIDESKVEQLLAERAQAKRSKD